MFLSVDLFAVKASLNSGVDSGRDQRTLTSMPVAAPLLVIKTTVSDTAKSLKPTLAQQQRIPTLSRTLAFGIPLSAQVRRTAGNGNAPAARTWPVTGESGPLKGRFYAAASLSVER